MLGYKKILILFVTANILRYICLQKRVENTKISPWDVRSTLGDYARACGVFERRADGGYGVVLISASMCGNVC